MSHGADIRGCKPSLSRLWCETCKDERIHNHSVCSCGTRHTAYQVREIAYPRALTVTRAGKRVAR